MSGDVDWLLYWFMLPVAVAVATLAMTSGIGGAALFTPFFLLVLPALGPEYPLAGAAAAVATALFIEVFGFTSGFLGYLRRRLIHFPTGLRILRISLPAAFVGALLAQRVPDVVIRGLYAALMVVLAVALLRPHRILAADPTAQDHARHAHHTDATGQTYHLRHLVTPRTIAVTAGGSLLTGLSSVGVGEVTVSQLTRVSRYPMRVAAGTSILVVIATVLLASITHAATQIAAGGLAAIPWNLLVWAVPGVIVGGQLGSRLQGRLPERRMEQAVAVLFILIAAAMTLLLL